eukprot:CAMPEP_0172725326 /NCGR_PEP_ID=MMETSP1074-20121228/88131_1 /TAXON_ID=2916 /ORGANISM="Ceratium fusus, Strain PA161109" /LENGTH=250 /DNA_ID=CAMNT_0013552065 /DNA_START=154 /DNA_END=902 /DNA_ORIENTATION=-
MVPRPLGNQPLHFFARMPLLICLLLAAPRAAQALVPATGMVQQSSHLQGSVARRVGVTGKHLQPVKTQQLVRGSEVESHGNITSDKTQDGTACTCVCGNRVVWRRELFAGNVKGVKEHECEHDICPYVNIPGLRVTAECTYVKDIRELTAGTVCVCQCGDKAAWHNRGFYGNVVEEKERECLQDVCPRLNPVPGYRFEADCRFDPNLFQMHPTRPMGPRQYPQQSDPYGACERPRPGSLVVLVLAALSSA